MNITKLIQNNTLRVIVRANASRNEIVKYDAERDALRVNIAAPAKEGKANAELIKYFSKITGKKVRILSGKTNKNKLLRLY